MMQTLLDLQTASKYTASALDMLRQAHKPTTSATDHEITVAAELLQQAWQQIDTAIAALQPKATDGN